MGDWRLLVHSGSRYQTGGEVSDRQWRDIISVLRASGEELDDAYLDATAEGAGLMSLLARARAER